LRRTKEVIRALADAVLFEGQPVLWLLLIGEGVVTVRQAASLLPNIEELHEAVALLNLFD
jgi:hypothetical protein